MRIIYEGRWRSSFRKTATNFVGIVSPKQLYTPMKQQSQSVIDAAKGNQEKTYHGVK